MAQGNLLKPQNDIVNASVRCASSKSRGLRTLVFQQERNRLSISRRIWNPTRESAWL